MSTDDALLAAVREQPHDDLPRLVYADWLDENGQPDRAEFIRVQCELALLDEYDPRHAVLAAREAELHAVPEAFWAAFAGPGKKGRFDRGFPVPSLYDLAPEALLALTRAGLAAAPLWRFHYNLPGRLFNDFLAWDALSTQELFSPRPPDLGRDWAERAAACPGLRNVSELATIDGPLGPDRLRVLLDAFADRSLQKLTLAAARVDDATLAVLAAHPSTARLRYLDVRENKVTAAGVRALEGWPFPTGPAEVSVAQNAQLRAAGVRALVRWPHLPRVRHLRVDQCRVGDEGAVAVAESRAAAGLRHLSLSHNGIGPDGARALARSPHLAGLQRLVLSENRRIGQDKAAVAELRERFGGGVVL